MVLYESFNTLWMKTNGRNRLLSFFKSINAKYGQIAIRRKGGGREGGAVNSKFVGNFVVGYTTIMYKHLDFIRHLDLL
jgi:hypothetical protein